MGGDFHSKFEMSTKFKELLFNICQVSILNTKISTNIKIDVFFLIIWTRKGNKIRLNDT